MIGVPVHSGGTPGKTQGIVISGDPEHSGGTPGAIQGMVSGTHPGGNLTVPIMGSVIGGMGKQGSGDGTVIGQPGMSGSVPRQGIVSACAGGAGNIKTKDRKTSAARKIFLLPAIRPKIILAGRMEGCSRIRGLRTTWRWVNWYRSLPPGAGSGIPGWGTRHPGRVCWSGRG